MNPLHVLPFSSSRRRHEARAIGSAGQLSAISLSSMGWRRGPGRGGAPVDAPLSCSLPTRSSRGESESLWLLDLHNRSHSEKALTLIFSVASPPTNGTFCSDQVGRVTPCAPVAMDGDRWRARSDAPYHFQFVGLVPSFFGALILLMTSPKHLGLAAEQDQRMVAPHNAVRAKLPSIAPTPARDAAKTFRVLDGFRMDLLAAEPLVASPVAMTYDENGRAYVCEMRDYPYTDKAHHQRNQENPTDAAIGAVRLLEDTDGDGVFDKSAVFADGLSWPTGVACWKGGVFVAATPDIWYFKDTDGDGKADIRRKVFTGFRKFNVQSVMNNLAWSLDNHIHGAGSSNGGQIRHAEKAEAKALVMTRQDFRFDPVREQFELLSGGARFGGTFDDWGHRFLCDIRNPAQHVVLPQRYLSHHPYLPARSALNDMAESGDQLPVYRISQPELWR